MPTPLKRQPIRVLLADDHAGVRDAMVFSLSAADQVTIVAQAADGVEAVQQAQTHQPDVVLMDVSMPRMNGIEATRRIAASHPKVQVIALLMRNDPINEAAMMEAGAVGSVDKADGVDQLLSAIRQVAYGKASSQAT